MKESSGKLEVDIMTVDNFCLYSLWLAAVCSRCQLVLNLGSQCSALASFPSPVPLSVDGRNWLACFSSPFFSVSFLGLERRLSGKYTPYSCRGLEFDAQHPCRTVEARHGDSADSPSAEAHGSRSMRHYVVGGGPPNNIAPEAFTQMGTHIQMCAYMQTCYKKGFRTMNIVRILHPSKLTRNRNVCPSDKRMLLG